MPFKSHFGMSRNPFNKENIAPKEACQTLDHLQLQSGLSYLVSVKGLGIVTAPSGFGKTFAIRCFVSGLDEKLYHTAYISLSTVSVSEFYRELARAVHAERKCNKSDTVHNIRRQIEDSSSCSVNRPYVIILDEAQELSTHILKDLKILTNFRYDSRYCFTLILCGTPELLDNLNKQIHEPLRQRIVYHYSLEGLSDEEVRDYVYHKLSLAGASTEILSEEALHALIGGCDRKVRIVDNAMTAALLLAAQRHKTQIDAPIMQGALESLHLV